MNLKQDLGRNALMIDVLLSQYCANAGMGRALSEYCLGILHGYGLGPLLVVLSYLIKANTGLLDHPLLVEERPAYLRDEKADARAAPGHCGCLCCRRLLKPRELGPPKPKALAHISRAAGSISRSSWLSVVLCGFP